MKLEEMLRQLQSRIDKSSNAITEWDLRGYTAITCELRSQQTLDKRIYAKLLETLRQETWENEFYRGGCP